jgi:transposase-like protein
MRNALARAAKADLNAFAGVPRAHWAKTWSTNPIEPLSKELKRRTEAVGIFPNPAATWKRPRCSYTT